MNLALHGLEPEISIGDSIYEPPSGRRFDVILTNPPFGTRGANQAPDREDFTVETSNKQLNFLQHVMTILKPGGRAAVVLPDNCLFADQAGEVMKYLTEDCDVHTVQGELTAHWREKHGFGDDWDEGDIESVAQVGTGSTPLRSNPSFFAEMRTIPARVPKEPMNRARCSG